MCFKVLLASFQRRYLSYLDGECPALYPLINLYCGLCQLCERIRYVNGVMHYASHMTGLDASMTLFWFSQNLVFAIGCNVSVAECR